MTFNDRPLEDVWADEDAGPVVRPYAMIGGRTESTRPDLDLISVVVTNRSMSADTVGLGPEHLAITSLCQGPLSVAEVAAHLDLPLGVVRVLLGDLLDRGIVRVRQPAQGASSDEQMLRAVINGLRSL